MKKNLTNEQIKEIISKETRKGRSNLEIKVELDEVIKNGSYFDVEKKFNEIIEIGDIELEKYTISILKNHRNTKVRESVAGYLLAYATGDNNFLDLEFVKNTLLEMKDEKTDEVRPLVIAGLTLLGEKIPLADGDNFQFKVIDKKRKRK